MEIRPHIPVQLGFTDPMRFVGGRRDRESLLFRERIQLAKLFSPLSQITRSRADIIGLSLSPERQTSLINLLGNNEHLFSKALHTGAYIGEIMTLIHDMASFDDRRPRTTESTMSDFVLGFLARNRSVIEQIIRTGNSNDANKIIRTTVIALRARQENHSSSMTAEREGCAELLLNVFDRGDRLPDDSYRYNDFVQALFSNANPEQLDRAVSVLQRNLDSDSDVVRQRDQEAVIAIVLKDVGLMGVEGNGKKVLEMILSKLGLDFKKTLNAWRMSMPRTGYDFSRALSDNLRMAMKLEEKQKGICEFLANKFNCVDFFRFPEEVWLSQWEEREDTTSPYFIMLTARKDHSGALSRHVDMYREVYNDAKKRGWNMRVMELEDEVDLKRLVELREKYGQVQFLYLVGHSNGVSVELGEKDWGRGIRGKLSVFLEEDTLRAISDILPRGGFFIFDSCSSGMFYGLIDHLSKVIPNVAFVGPMNPAYIKKLDVSEDDGLWLVDPDYINDDRQQVYKTAFMNNESIRQMTAAEVRRHLR